MEIGEGTTTNDYSLFASGVAKRFNGTTSRSVPASVDSTNFTEYYYTLLEAGHRSIERFWLTRSRARRAGHESSSRFVRKVGWFTLRRYMIRKNKAKRGTKMNQRTELEWIAVESSPPRSREELDRLRAALDRAGLVSNLSPDVQGGTLYELRVRPQDLDRARQIVLQAMGTITR